MHDGGAELVYLARIGLPGGISIGSLVSLANLISVHEVAGMFHWPREKAVVDRQLLTASLFEIDEQGSQYFLNGLYCLLSLSVPFGIASGSSLKAVSYTHLTLPTSDLV